MKTNRVLGGHLRAGEGLRNVPMEARALGYNLVQINLSADELGWEPFKIDDSVAAEYRKMSYGITTVVHLPFSINPCVDEPRRRQFARVTFRRFLKVAYNLGATRLVLHPGYKKEFATERAYQNLLKFFDGLIEEDHKGLAVLLETDSGSKNGSKVGSLEFCIKALDELKRRDVGHVGLCLDTAHMFARGVDLWDKSELDTVLHLCKEYLQLVHLNVPDPNVVLGEHLDRHNVSFASFARDSSYLVSQLLEWPCVLERRSLAVQASDVQYIEKLFG